MSRVHAILTLAVLVLGWELQPSATTAACPPASCPHGEVCFCSYTNPDTSNGGNVDSTSAWNGSVDGWGVGIQFPGSALTVGLDFVAHGSWVQSSLEKSPSTAPRKAGAGLLSVRVTREKAHEEVRYVVSTKSPYKKSRFTVVVLEKGKPTWSKTVTAGNLVVADEWPRFASVGVDEAGMPTVGWAFNGSRKIHPSGVKATVMGDQIRVSLEGHPTRPADLGLMGLHFSSGVKSMRVRSVRAGLFNLPPRE